MADLTGRILNGAFLSFSPSGKPLVMIELNEREAALNMVDELKAEEKLAIKVSKFREKRSLDANAYFHLLVNKIARKVNKRDDEVKRDMVFSYGTLARDENGDLIGAMLPEGAEVERFYPYARNYKTEYRDGRAYSCYLFYERTRDLDTAQMAKLIEGTIQEAQNLGIETRPQWEVDSLLEHWRN
jgi:hypothetical protein